MRSALIGDMKLVATPILPGSELVRFHAPADDRHYNQMVVVSPLPDNPAAILLSGWIGKPLNPHEWLEAQKLLYPDTTEVHFRRWREQGFKDVRLATTKNTLLRPPSQT